MKFNKMYRITSAERDTLHGDACFALVRLLEEDLPHADHYMNVPGQWSQYYYVPSGDKEAARRIERTVEYLRNTAVGSLGKLEVIPFSGQELDNQPDEYRVKFTHKDLKTGQPC